MKTSHEAASSQSLHKKNANYNSSSPTQRIFLHPSPPIWENPNPTSISVEKPQESNSVAEMGTQKTELKNPFANIAKVELNVDDFVANLKINPAKFDPNLAAWWDDGDKAPFLFLARAFDLIIGELDMIKITDITCNVLRTVIAKTPDDLLEVVYLLANKIAPNHQGLELGIGDATLIKALAEACGATEVVVKKLYRDLGDLGDVAKEIRSKQSMMQQPSPLTITKVFNTFQLIAQASGKDSQERKKNYIKSLIVAAKDCEPVYLMRLLQAKLRISLAEKTLLTALGQAAVYSEEHSKPPSDIQSPLEEDLGEVAKEICSKQSMMRQPPLLTITKVFDTLQLIAQASGKDSQERKKNYVKSLIVASQATKDCEPVYLMQLLQAKSRISLAEKTLLAALGQAAVYPEEHSKPPSDIQSPLEEIQFTEEGSVEICSQYAERNTEKNPDVAAALPRSFIDETCHSLDFLDIRPQSSGLDGTGVKVGVVDMGRTITRPLTDEFGAFCRTPKLKTFHNCDSVSTLNEHGYVCASIIGQKRREAHFYDVCEGEIQSVSPGVDLHMYVFGCSSCTSYDMQRISFGLAIDEAIRDDMRILSFSLSNRIRHRNFKDDPMVVGTLKALKSNVLSCVSAGNMGPMEKTIKNPMPWCLTVGACNVGKKLKAVVEIGTKHPIPTNLPYVQVIRSDVHEGDQINIVLRFKGASLNISDDGFQLMRIHKSTRGKQGELFYNEKSNTIDFRLTKSKSLVGRLEGIPSKLVAVDEVRSRQLWYIFEKLRYKPLYARICTSRFHKDDLSVSAFSGRGPAKGRYSEIIKPDLIAPGHAVVSSHPVDVPLHKKMPGISSDQTISYGTSFATPHVAGLAAIICSRHPTWSASMIKSALMTTAWKYPENGLVGNEFSFGAGIPRLNEALCPGLVYDEKWENFDLFMNKKLNVYRLNLPSFAASFPNTDNLCTVTFQRELLSVGQHYEDDVYPICYDSVVEIYDQTMEIVDILVEPKELMFEFGERKKFEMKVTVRPGLLRNGYVSGALNWIPSLYAPETSKVSSPIHLYINNPRKM